MSSSKPAPFRRVLIALFVIQFFSWSAMFALWINAVPFFAGRVLHLGVGGAQDLQPALVAVSLCFAGYAALGAAGTLVLPGVIARAGHGLTYGAALLIAALGFGLLALAERPVMLVPAFVAIGIGWSAIGSIPYAILGKLAPEGRGAFFTRLFSFSTVLPQAVTSLAIALFASRLFGHDLQRALVLGAGAMALAGLIALACRPLFAPADAIADDW
ncbi:MAG: hypothetical protein KGM49_02900 [Sphingomonadales bacterium]|nr:hypothetical protein [Sphingomonadales bacterium]